MPTQPVKTTADLQMEVKGLKAQGYDLVVAKEQIDQQLQINGQQIQRKNAEIRASIDAEKKAADDAAKLAPATGAAGAQLGAQPNAEGNIPSPVKVEPKEGGGATVTSPK